MALCMLIIQDNEDGSVDVKLISEPAINTKEMEGNTTAQNLAGLAMHAILKESGMSSEDDEETKEDFEASFEE